jgi:nickel/cobalt exporter
VDGGAGGVLVVVAGSAVVGVIHALLPDHWVPFVVLSKARRWDLRRSLTAVVAGGLAHLASTAALGLLLAVLGAKTIERIGPAAELTGAGILAVFGLVLSLRGMKAARRGGHRHWEPCDLAPAAGGSRDHILTGAVFGLRPCAEAIPIFFAAAAYGLTSSLLAIGVWMAATLGTMLAVVLVSLLGLRRLRMDAFERYGELVAGAVVLLMGLGATLLSLAL